MDIKGNFLAVFLLLVIQIVIGHEETTSTPPLFSHFSNGVNNPLIHGSDHIELALYKLRSRILLGKLRAECSSWRVNRLKRQIISELGKTQLAIEKVMYNGLTRMLTECRERTTSKTSLPTSSTTATSTITTATTTTSTMQPTTTSTAAPSTSTTTTTTLPKTTLEPEPVVCQSAVNLTESWRLDHNGSSILPNNGVVNCDTNAMANGGRPWFRFTGAAGQKMLDKCPPVYSCGTHGGMWTDEMMPAAVGVETSVTVFASYNNNCKYVTRRVSVMRCSTGNVYDFIYKYLDIPLCHFSFCGMAVN